MVFASRTVCIFLLIFILHAAGSAQKKDKVEVGSKISAAATDENCKDLKLSRALNAPKPIYPAEARLLRVGGTVRLSVKIDEKGAASEIETVSGHKLLQSAAIDAARKMKFSPTTCGGTAIGAQAAVTINFVPFVPAESYFSPAKVEEFSDITNDSPYYEAVLNLTENYKIAFGSPAKKFYPDAPLTRGDFAHFLRLTLDLLSERASAAKKMPREIDLFRPHNPQTLTSLTAVKDLKPNAPFYESVKTLLLKYDVSLITGNAQFQGTLHLTNNEVLDWWSKIFGEEAIPVNFARSADIDPIISRGEFALFLQESLQVLTYKVLP